MSGEARWVVGIRTLNCGAGMMFCSSRIFQDVGLPIAHIFAFGETCRVVGIPTLNCGAGATLWASRIFQDAGPANAQISTPGESYRIVGIPTLNCGAGALPPCLNVLDQASLHGVRGGMGAAA